MNNIQRFQKSEFNFRDLLEIFFKIPDTQWITLYRFENTTEKTNRHLVNFTDESDFSLYTQ